MESNPMISTFFQPGLFAFESQSLMGQGSPFFQQRAPEKMKHLP